ncbi:hypothetical protein E5288_WYG003043 [Bos mutus]|uniref:Uncharacterized protein n=1 Tax=Bos mutus TaxID=72004 RepID=A0A6B0R916_9CETA|nr:hypothetical protein [Bos mutus]
MADASPESQQLDYEKSSHVLFAHMRAGGNTDANRAVEAAGGDRAVNAPGGFLKQNLKLACLGFVEKLNATSNLLVYFISLGRIMKRRSTALDPVESTGTQVPLQTVQLCPDSTSVQEDLPRARARTKSRGGRTDLPRTTSVLRPSIWEETFGAELVFLGGYAANCLRNAESAVRLAQKTRTSREEPIPPPETGIPASYRHQVPGTISEDARRKVPVTVQGTVKMPDVSSPNVEDKTPGAALTQMKGPPRPFWAFHGQRQLLIKINEAFGREQFSQSQISLRVSDDTAQAFPTTSDVSRGQQRRGPL